MEKGSVTFRVLFEDPFWIGLIERVSAGIKAFAGARENREKVQEPAGERGSGGTQVSDETAKEKGKTSRTLKIQRFFQQHTAWPWRLCRIVFCVRFSAA